jgi:hypothetical protein
MECSPIKIQVLPGCVGDFLVAATGAEEEVISESFCWIHRSEQVVQLV